MLKQEFNEAINAVFGNKVINTNDMCHINAHNFIVFYNNYAIIKSNIDFTNKDIKKIYNAYNNKTKYIEELVDYLLEIKRHVASNDNIPSKEEVLIKIYENMSQTIKDYDKEEKRIEFKYNNKSINELLEVFDKKLDPFENDILGEKENLRFLDINANMENIDKYSIDIRNKETDSISKIVQNNDDKYYSIETKINNNTYISFVHSDSKKFGNNINLVEVMDGYKFINITYNLSNNVIVKKDGELETVNTIQLELFKEELELINYLIDKNMYGTLKDKENNNRKLSK